MIAVIRQKYGVDYEIYFWYKYDYGINSAQISTWNPSAAISSSSDYSNHWIYTDITRKRGTLYDYTGTAGTYGTGLQTLWVAIPWSELGITQPPSSFYVLAVLTGDKGSGSVDSIPYDPTVWDVWNPSTTQVYNTMYHYPHAGADP